MLKLRDNVLLNESQIVTAEYDENNKILNLIFTVPVTFALQDKSNPNQVTLHSIEAEQLWQNLSKKATDIRQSASSANAS